MKRFIVPILLTIVAVLAWVRVLFADDKPTGAAIYMEGVTAVSGGTFTNADSAPTWTLLKNGTTVVTTGTFTVTGTGTLAAHYYGTLTLNSATFSPGDWYSVEGIATISSVPVKSIFARGRVLPAEPNIGYPALGGGTIGGISGGSISIGTLTVTNGLSAATFNVTGAATFGSIRDSGSFTMAGIVNTGSLSTDSISSPGANNLGSITITGLANSGTLSMAGFVDSGTFSVSGASTFSMINIPTLTLGGTPFIPPPNFGSLLINSAGDVTARGAR